MRKILLLLLTLLTVACSRAPSAPTSAPPVPGPQAPPTAGFKPPSPALPAQPVTGQKASPGEVYTPPGGPRVPPPPLVKEAAAHLPASDLALTFEIRDYGAADFTPVQEYLLREGNRAVAVADGRAYAVWEIRPDGIWRADPKNPGALLHYLPSQLSDGLHWSQRSGDAEVWFRLAQAQHCSQTAPTCWELVVLNRGERTALRFGEGVWLFHASADNWADPTRSFVKYLDPDARNLPLKPAYRAEMLKPLAPAPAPTPVVEQTAAQFTEAVYTALQSAQPALQTIRLDLNGDGAVDLVQGRFDEWSTAPLQFYQGDGSSAGYPQHAGKGKMRVTRLPFPQRRPAFLIERTGGGDWDGVEIVTARENPYDHTWAMESVYGWLPKSQGAPADRVSWTQDGRITVQWDLKDPARHTRVTEYSWFEDPKQNWSGVQPQSVAYRPTEGELRYPATPKELLQAAFVTRWLGLTDELPRYFATKEAAAAFAAEKRVSKPDYGPGWVQIGTVTPPVERNSCDAKVAEMEAQGPGPHPFAAFWGGYEWCESAWGKVTFGTDAQGRPVIAELLLEGQAGAAE